MVPLKQKFLHKPDEGIYGDCHRACIASMLELDIDDVPNFGHAMPDGTEFNLRIDAFLRSRRLVEASICFDSPLDDVMKSMKSTNPGIYWILGGKSRTGVNHSVVCYSGEIVHDPSLTDAGIVGPCDDGYFWASFLVYQIGGRST